MKENKKQIELDFQEFKSQSIKSIETKHLNTNLPNKTSSSKFKKSACGQKKRPQALFFDNLITTEELAVIFGLAPQTIRNWTAQGKLPYVKIGKRNLFLKESLKRWLNRKEKSLWE